MGTPYREMFKPEAATAESDTPRTDADCGCSWQFTDCTEVIEVEKCRQIERELNFLEKKYNRLLRVLDEDLEIKGRIVAKLESLLAK